ncbi:toxic anion resistance protein [Acidithiobacillus sp. MC6.1]|nr:toxic anion resistance protein [Acidithiobacillus sp. MC6.1]
MARINQKTHTVMTREGVAPSSDSAVLRQFGVCEEDLGTINALAEQVDASNPASIHAFGAEIAQQTQSCTEEILKHARSRDLDVLGGKLEKILVLARDSQPTPAKGVQALPVVGFLVQRARSLFRRVNDRFASAGAQIETLVHEVEGVQAGMLANSGLLEEMYGVVQAEYRALGQHIVAGKAVIERLTAEATIRRADPDLSQMAAQDLADLDANIAALDKRVGNFVVLQQAALQKLPTIRMIQANHQTLLEKYHTVKDIVIPSWKHQALLATSLQEQHNAVALADAIDAQTNRMLKENSALLYTNSIEAAKANQRLSIDPKTLEDVQETLVKTIQDVIAIRQEGIANRKQVESRMAGLQTRMRGILVMKDRPGNSVH